MSNPEKKRGRSSTRKKEPSPPQQQTIVVQQPPTQQPVAPQNNPIYQSIIDLVKGSIAPRAYTTAPPSITANSAFVKQVDLSANWSIEKDTGRKIKSSTGMVVWNLNRGAACIHRYGFLQPLSSNFETFFKTGKPGVEWPGTNNNSVETLFGIDRMASYYPKALNENKPNCTVLFELNQAIPVIADSSIDVKIAPDLSQNFSQVRVFSGDLRMISDTIPIGNTALNGHFSAGSVSDSRDLVADENNRSSAARTGNCFDSSDLVQMSMTPKDGLREIQVVRGIVALVGPDVNPGYSPPISENGIMSRGEEIIVCDEYVTTPGYNFGPAGPAVITTSSMPNDSLHDVKGGESKMLHGYWVGPWDMKSVEAKWAIPNQITGDPMVPLKPATTDTPAAMPFDASPNTSFKFKTYNIDNVGLYSDPEISITLGFKGAGQDKYPHPQHTDTIPNIDTNNNYIRQFYGMESLSYVVHFASTYIRHNDTGDVVLDYDVHDDVITYGAHFREMDFQRTFTFIPTKRKNKGTWLGTLITMTVNNSGPLYPMFARVSTAFNVSHTHYPLTCGTTNYHKIVVRVPDLYAEGSLGPVRVIRWDSLSEGQQIKVNGVLNAQCIPEGTLAPFVQNNAMFADVASNLNGLVALAEAYNGDTPLRRVWTGDGYDEFLRTAFTTLDLSAIKAWNQPRVTQAFGAFAPFLAPLLPFLGEMAAGVGGTILGDRALKWLGAGSMRARSRNRTYSAAGSFGGGSHKSKSSSKRKHRKSSKKQKFKGAGSVSSKASQSRASSTSSSHKRKKHKKQQKKKRSGSFSAASSTSSKKGHQKQSISPKSKKIVVKPSEQPTRKGRSRSRSSSSHRSVAGKFLF